MLPVPVGQSCAKARFYLQVEADNLDSVTKSALLGQENQHLKEKLESQEQQLTHMQQQVSNLCNGCIAIRSHCMLHVIAVLSGLLLDC